MQAFVSTAQLSIRIKRQHQPIRSPADDLALPNQPRSTFWPRGGAGLRSVQESAKVVEKHNQVARPDTAIQSPLRGTFLPFAAIAI